MLKPVHNMIWLGVIPLHPTIIAFPMTKPTFCTSPKLPECPAPNREETKSPRKRGGRTEGKLPFILRGTEGSRRVPGEERV